MPVACSLTQRLPSTACGWRQLLPPDEACPIRDAELQGRSQVSGLSGELMPLGAFGLRRWSVTKSNVSKHAINVNGNYEKKVR